MVKKLKQKIKDFFFKKQDLNKVPFIKTETFYVNKDKIKIIYTIEPMCNSDGTTYGLAQNAHIFYVNNKLLYNISCNFDRKDFYNGISFTFSKEILEEYPELSKFNNIPISRHKFTTDLIDKNFAKYIKSYLVPFQK